MDLSELDWERLERYVSRRGTPEELAALDRWVRASAELRALAEAMGTVGQGSGEPVGAWDDEAAWRQVSRRMRWFTRAPLRSRFARGQIRWIPLAAAAVIALAAGSALVLVESRGRLERERPADGGVARELVTRRGERAAFNLADGTKVILGAESRLRIPAGYSHAGAGRELALEGEGYFDVVHDSTRPFRVHTPLGTAEDIGTAFVVTTYPEAGGMRVVVASGKVALRQRPRSPGAASPKDSLPLLTLTQGDLARLDSAGTATVSRVDPATYLSWTRGALTFNGTPLRDVLPQLTRWFDLDLRLADSSLASRRLTATFRDQSISQVLDLMALSLDLRVERDGRTVTLHPSSPRRPS